MKKPHSEPNNFRISLLVFTLAVLSFLASLYFSAKLQLNFVGIPDDSKNNLDLIIISILFISFLFVLIFHKKINFRYFLQLLIVLFATLGSLHSILFIYYKMSGITNGWIAIDNDTNFTGIFFFAIYTIIYNGFLCKWWDKQLNSIRKYILLFLIEIPNVIAWWILAFTAPLSYVGGMNAPGHFWMTLLFALSVVLTLTGIRLYMKESAEAESNSVIDN